jgi:hypothetical protein
MMQLALILLAQMRTLFLVEEYPPVVSSVQ